MAKSHGSSDEHSVTIVTESCPLLCSPKMRVVDVKRQHVFLLVLGVLVCGTVVWYHQMECHQCVLPPLKRLSADARYKVWPQFNSHFAKPHSWYKRNCFGNKYTEFDISVLYELVEAWRMSSDEDCRALFRKFSAIYTVRQRSGGVVVPKPFEPKVKKWLGGNEELFKEVSHQTITMVYNELTDQHTIFNPIRAKRPLKKPEEPERQYIQKQQEEMAKSCDFCKYKQFTAEDTFGRVENKYAFSAANTFKYDAYHSLFITRTHHPLDWKLPDLLGVFDIAKQWFTKVHSIDAKYRFPLIIWDLNLKAGASQIHPHLHGSLDTSRYYGIVENWRRAGQEYYDLIGGGVNYFTDQLEIHNALGLAVHYGSAAAYATITPKKDNEVVVLATEPTEDFFRMIYFVTRAFLDDMEILCYSSGIVLPEMGDGRKVGKIPAYARFITRGAVAEVRADISSLELFVASQVNRDPFVVISFIKKSIEKRGQS